MRTDGPLYERILERVRAISVIDCHEHMFGPEGRPKYAEPIAALIAGYVFSDLQSAGFGISDREIGRLQDPDVATDEKWPLFHRLWSATEHTAYARVTKHVLRASYGVDPDGPNGLDRSAIDAVAARLSERTEERYFADIDEAGIEVLLVDVLGWLDGGLRVYLDGTKTFPDKWRPLISLPGFHPTTFTRAAVDSAAALVGNAGRCITTLEGYLEAVFEIFRRCVDRGAIGIKDQSAYGRQIDYELASRSDAERQFNRAISDPNQSVGWPEGKPLNDFLFHRFMDFAGELGLPVQLHTGHMAGIRNRVEKTNAANLATVLDVHRNVRFDLFHGNWPYLGDLLFLGKNYPNVAIDCCWLHIIDPAYAVELLDRATLTLPHTKVHGFGGDYGDVPEFVAGHLEVARQNIAEALAGLVGRGWLDEERSDALARDWLFNNPNRFFSLGLDEI